jgi:BCD family chlorophyll transporter-like MFS transporter
MALLGAATPPLRWLAILRMGMVQAALGSVVVLVTSTLNRVMVVEYALPALLPGMLVAMHYAVQMIRPRFGHGSDRGGRRTPWIIGGMAVLAGGGVLASVATTMMGRHFMLGMTLAVAAYALVGAGVGAAGTSLLVLMAKRVDERRRAAAATIMWILMIAGFAVTSTAVGYFLDPFSPQRLVTVASIAAAAAFLVGLLAIWRVEAPRRLQGADLDVRGQAPAMQVPLQVPRQAASGSPLAIAADGGQGPRDASFRAAMQRVWRDPQARGFTLFVFVSMLAYSAQELLLEPFCGLVFGYSLGASARLSGTWHAAALIGMIATGVVCSGARRGGRVGSLRAWTIGGCCGSAVALVSLAGASVIGPGWPLRLSVIALGVSNGVFTVAAIGTMLELAQRGEARTAGVRMGLWGAAQAVAFAVGGLAGSGIVDAFRWLFGSPIAAFAVVFSLEALMFFAAAIVAARIDSNDRRLSAANSTAVIA